MIEKVDITQELRSAGNVTIFSPLNEAFEKLQGILPNHCRDRPLSKMEALQLAQNYIKELTATLQNDTERQQIKEDYSSVYY